MLSPVLGSMHQTLDSSDVFGVLAALSLYFPESCHTAFSKLSAMSDASGIKEQLVPLTPAHPVSVIYPVPWHSFLLYAGVGYLHGNVSATAEGGAVFMFARRFSNDAKGLSILSIMSFVRFVGLVHTRGRFLKIRTIMLQHVSAIGSQFTASFFPA